MQALPLHGKLILTGHPSSHRSNKDSDTTRGHFHLVLPGPGCSPPEPCRGCNGMSLSPHPCNPNLSILLQLQLDASLLSAPGHLPAELEDKISTRRTGSDRTQGTVVQTTGWAGIKQHKTALCGPERIRSAGKSLWCLSSCIHSIFYLVLVMP